MLAKQYIDEMKQEVSKVDWPTKQRVTSMTGIVLVVVIAMAFYTFFVDVGLGLILVR